jgi:hypothetical protein
MKGSTGRREAGCRNARGRCLLIVGFLAFGSTSFAQGVDEIIVTAARTDSGDSMPGTFLRKTGDFLLLQVDVRNDTREADARKEEIYTTLRTALAAARRAGDIELSVVDESDLVIPLKVDSATVLLRPGDRPDTSVTRISVKTPIPKQGANGQELISKLKDFVAGIKETGRTRLSADGDVNISVVAPHTYRDEIIALYAADAKKVTGALGDEYKVVTQGIDRPVRWVRMGLLELALFVPYRYDVLPTSVNTYVNVPQE